MLCQHRLCTPTGEAQWEGRPCNAKHGAVVISSGAPAWAFTLTEGAPMLDTWPPLPGAESPPCADFCRPSLMSRHV